MEKDVAYFALTVVFAVALLVMFSRVCAASIRLMERRARKDDDDADWWKKG